MDKGEEEANIHSLIFEEGNVGGNRSLAIVVITIKLIMWPNLLDGSKYTM